MFLNLANITPKFAQDFLPSILLLLSTLEMILFLPTNTWSSTKGSTSIILNIGVSGVGIWLKF